MSLIDFFTPVDTERLLPNNATIKGRLGTCVTVFTDHFPDLKTLKPDLAIIGVQEDRNASGNTGCALGPDYIREKLYHLYEGSYKTKIVDLGNIRRGETVTDTYIAVKTVLAELIKMNILPIIIGGSQDLTYAQYLA
ncbi:MAG: arginase, partial [Sphingobacteriaceae bacterium]